MEAASADFLLTSFARINCAVCGFCTAAAVGQSRPKPVMASRRVNAATLVLAIELANEDFQKLAPKGAAN